MGDWCLATWATGFAGACVDIILRERVVVDVDAPQFRVPFKCVPKERSICSIICECVRGSRGCTFPPRLCAECLLLPTSSSGRRYEANVVRN